MGRAEFRKQLREHKKKRSKNLNAFKAEQDELHTRAYNLAVKHMTEAMNCHKRISKKMVDEVLAKADEIRSDWDRINKVTVEATEGFGEEGPADEARTP